MFVRKCILFPNMKGHIAKNVLKKKVSIFSIQKGKRFTYFLVDLLAREKKYF